jgi:alpha-tubulin suppressor-like RCC1 family protein
MRRLRTALATTVTALLCAILVTAVPASAAEVLTNGGFESGSLSPWSCSGTTGSVVTTPVHTGTKALHGAATTADDAQCAPRPCPSFREPRTR